MGWGGGGIKANEGIPALARLVRTSTDPEVKRERGNGVGGGGDQSQ